MPVAGEQVGRAVAQQRAAQGDAELAVLGGVHPADRARVPAAVQALELGDRLERPLATARRRPPASGAAARPARPPSAARRAGRGSGVARCWMFATLTSPGSGAGLDPDRMRARAARSIRCDDDLVLGAVLVADAAAARRGGRRPPGRRCAGSSRRARRSRARARAAHQQLRAGAEERAPRACRSRSRSRTGTARAARRRAPPGRARAGASHHDLAGQHDLLELPGADPLDGRGHRRPRSRPGGGRSRSRGRRRSVRDRAAAAAPRAAPRAGARDRATVVVAIGARRRATASGCAKVRPRPERQSETSGRTSSAGGNDDQCADAAPVGAKAKPPTQTGPAPAGRPAGSSAIRPRADRSAVAAPRPRTGPAPRETASWALPSAASANPSRSGCSQQNQRSPAQPRGEHAPRSGRPARPRRVALTRRPPPPERPRLSSASSETEQRRSAVDRRVTSLVGSSRAGDRDLAGAHHLDQAVRADHPLEGVDLVVPSRSPRSSACGARRRRSWP